MFHSRNRLPAGMTPADVDLMDSMPKQVLYVAALRMAEGDREVLKRMWAHLYAEGVVAQAPKGAGE